MATCATLLADLNERLNDSGNTTWTEARKISWLNFGQEAMWPRIYKTARDDSLELAADTWEYDVPAAVGSNSKILRVEIETGDATGRFVDGFDFDIVPGLTDPILVFRGSALPGGDGARIRITAAKHLTPFSSSASTYDGPAGTEELPVLYAMGIALAARLEDRMDHRRYSTTNAVNGVGPGDIMDASQFWYSQFELLLDRMAMPLPAQMG